MSYSAPGPQRRELFGEHVHRAAEEISLVERARRESERLAGRPGKPPKKPQDVVASRPARPEEMESSAGSPPVLKHLLEQEEIRATARAANDMRLADRALREVVGDLDHLLGNAETHLRLSARGKSRQTVKEAMPQLVAMSSLATLPFGEVADILDLERERVDDVLESLALRGGLSPSERHDALKGVQRLRAQLRRAETTRNHSLLDRLVRFTVKIAVLLGVAVGAAPLAALAVGESVLKEVIKAGVVALVALALQRTADGMLNRRATAENLAHAAHEALIEELNTAHCLYEQPAYTGEHAVVRFRIAVRCAAARIASVDISWQEKQQYWAILDELTQSIDESPPVKLVLVQRRLRAFPPPARS